MANQDLIQLKIKRGQVKAQLTRIKNFLESYEENNPLPIQARLQKTETLWDKFDEVQSTIECEFPDEISLNERTDFENCYFATVSQLNETILNLSGCRQARPRASTSLLENGEALPQARLPTLQLPSFSGDYDKWLSFKDSFLSLIEAHPSLPDIQKFQYLRSSLKGEALQAIQALQATAENYKVSWDLLSKRYENKRLIINTHIKALFELAAVFKENHINLRKFIDVTRTHIRSLQALGEPVGSWNTMIIFLLNTKLDFRITKDWEERLSSRAPEKINEMPTIEDYLEFLESRCQTLEMTDRNIFKQQKQEKRVTLINTSQQDNASSLRCTYCNKDHRIYVCKEFMKLSVSSRIDEIKKRHLCMNCLKPGHNNYNCRSTSCRKCKRRHHSLLHKEWNAEPIISHAEVQPEQSTSNLNNTSLEAHTQTEQNLSVSAHCREPNKVHILLSTAKVLIYDNEGNLHSGRALLDAGSQSHFITESLYEQLKIKSRKIYLPITGINETFTNITKCVNVKIKSCINQFSSNLECLVVPKITGRLPQLKFDITNIKIPSEIILADTNFNVPEKIDILIGSELFWELLCPNKINLQKGQPILQETKLGWIIAGPIYNQNSITSLKCHVAVDNSLDKQIEKFWKTEEIEDKKSLSLEELQCEEYFQTTTTRNFEGRFIVKLPKNNTVQLGDSLDTAKRRLYSLEKRLDKDPQLKLKYQDFMEDYQTLGHMSLVRDTEIKENNNLYYLPHHPVIRDHSITTKVRVVFDGSAKTSSGASLNDLLLVGPVIQPDLINIILRFRTHQYVLTADIAMMYRQIKIHDSDKNLQRICWRKNSSEEINFYTLNTVTYGTSSAPFLATRCLVQLAQDEGERFPLAKNVLKNDFYMDDLLTGCHTKDEALQLQQELIELLSLGKFPLRKWRSNDPEILRDLQVNSTDSLIVLNKEEPVKTLGLLWNSTCDTIQYSLTLNKCEEITKRTILSNIASNFDPLGLIGPVVTTSKIIMQYLWKHNLDWDEPVPDSIKKIWLKFYNELIYINEIKISRNINPSNVEERFDIHGFSDASEKAFGAAVYAVSIDKERNIHSHLVCSKSRVAPLKTLTLPRLELNAALLLCKLTLLIKNSLKEKIRNIYHWTDSTIVLTWVKTPPHLLKTFIANRVSEIQHLSPNIPWYHVPSKQNPADVLSRGTSAEILVKNSLWWFGPTFLLTNNWPDQLTARVDEGELELKPQITLMTTDKEDINTCFTKFSSFQKLKRVIAYCKRFSNNSKDKENRKSGPLTVEELEEAAVTIILIIQHNSFEREFQDLNSKKFINKKSKLVNLNPFLDDNELLRVGGRLKNATVYTDQKHPIILPTDHFVTRLIIEEEHKRLMHGGHEQVLASIRLKYWPISGRRLVKKITRQCLQCFRFRPRKTQHIMGNLPSERICLYSRPFVVVGIDYAGPIQIREGTRRGRIPISKAYIAVFICLATKATHLELVSNLTTEAFLAAVYRFTARRGLCNRIFSDNATNFVGANQKLKDIYKFVLANQDKIATDLSKQNISWKFIPPRSPHFGGIWESAVKSMKSHFYKTTQNIILTFEECYTLLTGIEACLNSRPLTPISSDPLDLIALTPAHFLLGDSLLQPVEENLVDLQENRLSRWQHLQQVRQHFWNRWSREYLHQLQTRTKWIHNSKNLKIGAMVLLMEDNLPPLRWVLGRITEIHPGEDGVVRVVSVKTAKGIYKRAVRKLCELPISDLPVE